MRPDLGVVSLDAALALLPAMLETIQRLDAKVDRLLARAEDTRDSWLSPSAWAREMGVSVDTTERMIERGEVDVREISRTPLRGKDGQQLLDRHGRPRFRRTLRLRLTRSATAAEVRAVAAEMVGTASPRRGGRRERLPAVNGAQSSVGAPWPAEPAEAGH